jgi:hypothetical protein
MLFRTQYNHFAFPTNYERNTEASMTIPDQSMTVVQILERHSRGLTLGGAKVPIYDGEDDYFPDPRTLDLAERQQMIEDNALELIELKTKYARDRAAHAKAQKAAQKQKPIIQDESTDPPEEVE